MAVQIASFLLPIGNQKFFLLEDIYLRGGFRVVPSVTERNAIHPSTKKVRMVVVTADDGKIWQLQPDNSTWAELRTKTSYFPFFTHDQPQPANKWVVSHGKDTKYFSYTMFDADGVQVFPNEAVIVNSNTVEFRFHVPVAGHVTLAFAESS